MARGSGTIGPTLLLAMLGLPMAALAGLYWRFFPPSGRSLDDLPVPRPIIIAEKPAEG
ncbi:MAG TPA: hypothetical protein VIB82_07800 [Caulobacteraceae bacterium]|jgi:hypothetical protein